MTNILFPQRDEDDGETFYESYQTPHPRPAPRPPLSPSVKSPASAVSPSYPASEYSDWDTETTGSEAEADKTPTHRHKEASLTLEELQEAAKRLNLSLVTSPAHIPAHDPAPASIPDLQPAPAPAPAPTAPPRQKSDLCAEDLKGNVADDPSLLATNPCMAAPAPSCPSLPLINTDPGCPSDPDIVDQDTIEDPEPVPDNPETDDVSTSTNEDDTSLSDESECTTVMFLDKKNVVGKTEMRFRDIYDDVVAVDEVQSPQEIASGRLSDNKDTIVENAPTIEENLKQAMEINSEQVETETSEDFEAVTINTEEAQAREASPKNLVRVDESSTHPRAMSESTETLRTEEAGAKPRSYKKVKAPQPPGPGSQSSLVTPAETILHLSPVRDTDTEVSQEQPEPEQGRVLYKSRGYDEEVYEKTRPVKINIKQDSLESQMLGEGETMGPKSQVTEPAVSNTFIKNQDFLQPLIKERDAPPSNRSSGSWSHAGQLEESHPAPPPPLIRETYPFTSPAPTRLFTYNPSSGAIGLRKYDVAEDGESYGRLPRPASPLASRYTSSSSRPGSPALADLGRASSPLEAGESSLGRCPHCTIHSWLPHSPGCLNRNRK